MNSNQRSQDNNQSDKGANEKSVPTPRAGARRQNQNQQSQQQGSMQSGQQQGMPGQRQSNDAAGGLPKSPGGKRLSADQDMDEDTGLSNRANRQSTDDVENRQSGQSNVGRRDDLTPD